VGTAGRGTALITRDEFTITNVKQLPSGRGIAAEYKGIRMINIYAHLEQLRDRKGNTSTPATSPIY